MPQKRGRAHTTLTPTAKKLVRIIEKIDGVKMIAPGEISPSRSKSQRITFTETVAGLKITVSGNGIQRLAIHLKDQKLFKLITNSICESKIFKNYIFSIKKLF